MFTPFNNERKDSDIDMTPSGYFPNYGLSNSRSYMAKMNSKIRCNSLLAIGNPIVDISAEVTREILDKYHLKFGETVFADKNNVGFYQELENMPQVSYIPGGSIQNTLRIAAYCLNLEPSIRNFFKLTMLGATGADTYRDKIINSFNQLGVNHILEKIPNAQTSRCGVGIHMKERCLLPEIRASNLITDEFIKENMGEIIINSQRMNYGLNWEWSIIISKRIIKKYIFNINNNIFMYNVLHNYRYIIIRFNYGYSPIF